MDLSPLNFDQLARIEVPVNVFGTEYVLKEATEGDTIAFRSFQFENAQMVGEKMVTNVVRVVESRPLLVSLCLYDRKGERVPLETVKGWPPSIVGAIHDRAMQISRMERQDSVEELEKQKAEIEEKLKVLRNGGYGKNSPSATPVPTA